MAREVNIYTGGWRATDKTISVPQYEVTGTGDITRAVA